MTTRSIKNKKINDALFSKFKELEEKINSRNVVNFGNKTNSRNVINYGRGNNNKTNSNYTSGSNTNNTSNTSNSERDLQNHVKEIIKTNRDLKHINKLTNVYKLQETREFWNQYNKGVKLNVIERNIRSKSMKNTPRVNSKGIPLPNGNTNVWNTTNTKYKLKPINETWNKMDKIKRLEFPIEQLSKGDPKQEKALKKVTKLIQGRIDSIVKLYNDKKPIAALRSLLSFLAAVIMISQSITTGKSTMNEFVIGPYIREGKIATKLGFSVVSQDIGLVTNLYKVFFQTSVTHSQGITTGLLTDVTGKGSSIVGILTTIYAIILSLWISSIGRGKFGPSKGNYVLAQMTRLVHFFNQMVIKELIPNMIEASGERRASEAKRIALVSDYSKKTVTFLGGALLKKMLG
tara:strand:+ start:62 stop:1273 length:1212 start_codon:yes stop_codon:yes gene_type:complete